MKTPAHSKLPACKAFNVEILQLQRNPNCTKRFEADILKLCWWLTYLQSLEQYMFPIYLLDWLEAGLKGNQYPTAANFLRTTPSKLEFFFWSKPVSMTTESIKLPAQNTFKIGVLHKPTSITTVRNTFKIGLLQWSPS